MDLQPYSEVECALVSTIGTTGSAPYAGAFFPQASGFRIRGGAFTSNVTNNIYNLSPEQSSDFKTIRLGDLKLVRDVRLSHESSTVHRLSRGVGVRRIYHAEIRRNPGLVTVAMYQGDGAEEEWRQHVAKYESIRHPNIVQLYGLVSTKGLYAMSYILVLTQPIIKAREFWEAINYMYDVFRKPSKDYDNSSVWIRPSTGELYLDLVPGGEKIARLARWWNTHGKWRNELVVVPVVVDTDAGICAPGTQTALPPHRAASSAPHPSNAAHAAVSAVSGVICMYIADGVPNALYGFHGGGIPGTDSPGGGVVENAGNACIWNLCSQHRRRRSHPNSDSRWGWCQQGRRAQAPTVERAPALELGLTPAALYLHTQIT
ncbi:hypothetical protein MSAN_01504200 [Mycena sanguinolenta]|uniref:Protein kinase domain-containing protein n=1 Tax=Mycena sanguinolenta TaxID=230812 RepID=A0A8H6Y7C0_9AGAR|nr:hypothetical protein MSAN_01504200 [Mycena sanguinolenta]